MRPEIRSMEGIVLRAGKGREGGRLVSVFTREMGFLRLGVSRQALSRYGTGLMLPFAHIRFTGAFYPDYSIMTQYEGGLLFDMMAIPYEEMSEWYYVIELASLLFPEEEADEEAFDTLLSGGRAAKTRNRRVTAFVTAVKLLAIAGFDPAQDEPAGEHFRFFLLSAITDGKSLLKGQFLPPFSMKRPNTLIVSSRNTAE